jgi:hypothetical protein
VAKGAKPRKQKLRKMSTERAEAAKAKVQRLLYAGVIQPVQYPGWLANVVMVRKKNVKWQMCVDFTDLNKCYPKDLYPLLRIDKLVDIMAGCEVMSLLDCFSRYHQIWLNQDDEEKTSFITLGGTYCYQRMPKGLRNGGPIFSRMIDGIFNKQKGKILVAYVLTVVIIHHKLSTLCIEIVTNRNLGVLTDNFYKF